MLIMFFLIFHQTIHNNISKAPILKLVYILQSLIDYQLFEITASEMLVYYTSYYNIGQIHNIVHLNINCIERESVKSLPKKKVYLLF